MNDAPKRSFSWRRTGWLRAWARVLKWARKARLWVKIEILLGAISLVLAGLYAYFLSQNANPFALMTDKGQSILHIASVAILVLAGLITYRLVKMWLRRKESGGGPRLQERIIRYFGLVAFFPSILLALFYVYFLELGMQSWFNERVRATLNDSLEVADAYIEEHRRVIQADLLAMANDINRQALVVSEDERLMQVLVDDQAAKRALSEAIVFDGNGNILAISTLSSGVPPNGISKAILERARLGDPVIISDTSDDRVRAVIKLNFFLDTYLYVSRFVDPAVLAHVQSARDSIAEYQTLEQQRSGIQLSSEIGFLGVALLVLSAAIWVGFWLSRQLTQPIQTLSLAAEKVGQGEFKTPLPSLTSADEIGTLSRAFDRMTQKIESQHRALIKTNRELDERRRFSEAVLSGVSAGVLGLDNLGRVTLPNRAACEFFACQQESIAGKRVQDLMPGLTALWNQMLGQKLEAGQAQVDVERDGKKRSLLVRIAAEVVKGKVEGYVVTFDDITDQLSDQRTAAWADVARRIAHEIKNPLTPIQLSAERLKRKYAGRIGEDEEVFHQCTETIIRQVNDLRRMVDEFSSFARMPTPVFRRENVTDLVRQTVFLHEVGSPAIAYQLDLPKEPVALVCDGRQISQAITNLIKNAGESILQRAEEEPESAGPKGKGPIGNVRIALKASPGALTLTVEDDGAGLPKGMIERLTEPYVTTRAKGTGLGLAIVKKIMEDHSGTLKIENRKRMRGARATMIFNLTALTARQRAANEDALDAAPSPQRTTQVS
jgi:two-component system, NtrC family, nitrogen regulation sensor histidine kinase NtrY